MADQQVSVSRALGLFAASKIIAAVEGVSMLQAGSWWNDGPESDENQVSATFHLWRDRTQERRVEVTLRRWYGGGWLPKSANVIDPDGDVIAWCRFDSDGNIVEAWKMEPGVRGKVKVEVSKLNPSS